MRTIAGIDANVGRVLQKLDDLSITNNTAVIYISDNGFFRGEHQLGDKRAPYEESIRLPFMIRYPAIQPNNSGLVSDGIALNLDIAPTILDIAGVSIPEHMQGTSLLPLVRGENPSNWRQSFFYQYNHDPEFPTARVRPYIALRHENGFKIVKYEEDKNWNEIYNTSTSDDPYEINNLINDPSYLSNKNEMENLLNTAMHNTNFLRSLKFDIRNTGGKKMIQAGATYNFKLQTSSDLVNWGNIDQFSGEGETELNLVKDSSYDSMNTIYSDYSDYMIIENDNSAANITGNTIAIGSYASWEGVPNAGGRNAVLIFQIPPIPNGDYLAFTELEITAMKRYQPGFKCDLYSLGIHDAQAFPIIDYNEGEDDSNRKIIGGFFDASVGNDGAKVYSSIISKLTILINDFYGANPDYNGGKYLFLRLSPSYDPQQLAHKFLVYSSNETDTSRKPKLKLYFKETSNIDPKYFYRISYGNQ